MRFFCVLMSCYCIASPCYAAWAKHEIITPESDLKQFPFSVTVSEEDSDKILIHLPTSKPAKKHHKGYFLVTAVNVLPKEKIEFRSDMLSWRLYAEQLERLKRGLPAPERRDTLKHLEEITPLEIQKTGEQYGVSLTLDREVALRSYLVYDFKPMGGGMVRDGGTWITYDLPAFVRALPK